MLNLRNIRPNNLSNLLPALEQHERGHRANTKLLRHCLHLIHVYLVELDLGVAVAPFFDLRCNRLAGAAPFCEAVEDDGVFGVHDFGLEIGEAVIVSCGVDT